MILQLPSLGEEVWLCLQPKDEMQYVWLGFLGICCAKCVRNIAFYLQQELSLFA